ncbi:hypothetical protein LZ31DRAFT_10620 [Colletotrichum somersetense]|nr:hypothetical protein LZ31DRAFT_10620 [Colletotrichum somersetense]
MCSSCAVLCSFLASNAVGTVFSIDKAQRRQVPGRQSPLECKQRGVHADDDNDHASHIPTHARFHLAQHRHF